jgi:HK97 family phage major capsid protein
MSASVLERIVTERDEVRSAAIAMAEQDSFDPSDETFQSLQTRASELDKRAATLAGLMEQQQASDALDSKFSKAQRRSEDRNTQTRELSWGETFVRSSVFTEWSGRGSTGKLDVETRALPHTLSDMKDALPSSPIYDLTPPEPPQLLIPLTNVVTVSTNAIDYVVWELISGAAAVVAEGAKKPELEWKPTVTSSSLDTIAGTTSFTRQLAEDASAVTSFLNGELQREVTKKVEAEAKAALAAATLPTANGPADAGVSGAIRAGKAAVQAAGYNPNAVLMSASDSVDVDISSMALFRGDPYWGLTPVIDPDAADGTVIVGDFKAGVQHYRRNSVQLFLTDSHADAFVYNIIWALAEQRAKTIVTKPAAMVEVSAG